MLSDSDNGSVSSKRVIAISAFLLCAMGYICNMFWGYNVVQFMYDSMMYIVIAGIGGAALEKFTPKK
jgi:multisubunit Na+/H+ antiporter MnhF subunit